ncbi:C40 family peptidase [Clostridium bowmanii]|uniref:C40 family peptidase n=1 Tax=Clostridium bowmanii TaxID=132925 RepID=UPI001C0D7940|nr:C40 family peptidase [Clostridium bowmanii]MBU3187986.1 C40 family peptidase [Clostridium bowmanii]MCA1072163.1 C40 family peptidase [Clostridium bowmanii]
MRKRVLSLLIATGLAMSASMPIVAAPLSEQLNNQKKQLQVQQDSYTELQKNFEKLEISIEKLDFDIESIYSGIDKAKQQINDTENKIEQNTKNIAIAQENIKGEEDLFNERMRVMFMNGADTYLEILLDSEGLEDFISRVENVKKIVEYDNQIISELNVKKQDIEDKKEALNDSKTKILALQAENENKLDKLSIKKKEQSKLIVEAKTQQELHKNEITETQALLGSTMSEIKNASNQTPKYEVAVATQNTREITPSRGSVSNIVNNETREEPVKEEPAKEEPSRPQNSSSVSSNGVIDYAESFLGTPYEWAATGPNTFDCSGFVQYVYAHFGVSTGRSTYDQITHGTYVSRKNLQAGDLVFFGSGSPHHVGIYVGNNSYIHAPSTGDVVKISQLTRSDYMSARRVR